ncbi:eukaryotic translation initiation factor 4E type 2 isoform X3 [Papio anubis]|uniref:eukaryotic translation initiation factor 4E type 2 isoform X3 n=1 Tax=Papio anubis TaxID=9555 RepID=UPI000B7B2CBB|nr:eukaryotic translation initiation factor 4E type 2 isoform X3 [Papio anubis]
MRQKVTKAIRTQAVVPGPAEHPLQYNYTFWYSRRTPGRPTSSQSYEQNIKQIGTFASVEQFWRFYSHMVRPGDLTGHSDFHLFKEGIKPMWEDDANKNGGKWIIRLRKGLASRCWENLILAMLGEQFMVGEEICGAVVSVRFQEDIISIWNKTASDQATTARIRDTLRRVLNLPPNTIMEYKTHTDSINLEWKRKTGQLPIVDYSTGKDWPSFSAGVEGTIQAFEIQKSHCESTQAGNNPFLYVCVCPKWMGGLQPVLPLLTEGTSLSRALPFCTHSWRTDSARHPPASLTL